MQQTERSKLVLIIGVALVGLSILCCLISWLIGGSIAQSGFMNYRTADTVVIISAVLTVVGMLVGAILVIVGVVMTGKKAPDDEASPAEAEQAEPLDEPEPVDESESANVPEPVGVPEPADEPEPESAEKTCPNCGTVNAPGNNFCEQCGTKL